MVQLAAVYQHFVTERRKVALVIACLPYHARKLAEDKSVSFLRRAAQETLERIPDGSASSAFGATVAEAGKSIEPDALESCVQAIGGFPYLMQLVGYRTWAESGERDAIGTRDAELGIRAARLQMEEHILAATYRELSRVDLRFLEAMLDDGPESRMSDIAKRMGVKYNYADNYKRRLLAQGVIEEPATGVVRFEIPGFRDYVAKRRGL